MPRLLLLLLLASLPDVAQAWCQNTNVTVPLGGCRQRCAVEDDAVDARFLRLLWEDRDLTWVLAREGSRDLPRDQVIAIVDAAFTRWTGLTCEDHALRFDVSFDPEPSDDEVAVHRLLGPNENQVLFDDEWVAHDHEPGAYAITATYYNTLTGEMLGADLELNEERWTFATCPPDGCSDGRVDLANTVTHELGHFFGLAHTPESADATMWACAAHGETLKRDLEPDDMAGMCALYGGHVEGGCGCAAPGAGRSNVPWVLGGLVLVAVLARRAR
ncbi:MAG: matrixin family metalloprotease [Sandaracinus sp.]|nr:matrixin family metalloprotease [Sandaracinus sp.]MCB9613433.1 matrixin family metalloprotease [Sandaracinus sp.]MCB9617545.1 matrixin family metalloprotease [Sandaracinus sp.]